MMRSHLMISRKLVKVSVRALFVTMLSLLPAYNCTVYVSIIHFTVEC